MLQRDVRPGGAKRSYQKGHYPQVPDRALRCYTSVRKASDDKSVGSRAHGILRRAPLAGTPGAAEPDFCRRSPEVIPGEDALRPSNESDWKA